MRILILSFYHPPDLSAGSFRVAALIKALQQRASGNIRIDVITTLPNRYSTFSSEAQEHEYTDQLNIHRVKLPDHRSGILDQSMAFMVFARSVLGLVSGQRYDLVYATSSRLMTATLGAWVAKKIGARLYLDVRDIFVDTIKDVMSRKLVFFAKPLFSMIERWTINQADKVNLVSEGFRGYFELRYPSQQFSFFTNGVDEEFVSQESKVHTSVNASGLIEIVYAGNMGDGQGLHCIIPKLASLMSDRVCFRLIGDGGRRQVLEQALVKEKCRNVELLPPVNRDKLLEIYRQSDVLFLHLNDYEAFRKVLPSKLFEYAATGKPVWAGLSGFSAEFVQSEINNAAVFYPCNAEEAEEVFSRLTLETQPRKAFVDKFLRSNIMDRMVDDVLTLVS